MLTTLDAAGLQLSGVSVGGVYTSILAPQLDVILDVGVAPRSFVGASNLLLTHGHADHIGALSSLLGVRGLSHMPSPRVFLPAEISEDVAVAMAALNRMQHRQLEVSYIPLEPGDEHLLYGDLYLRAFRTEHSIPSLGYLLFRRVKKLRPEFRELPPEVIRDRRQAGDDLFSIKERGELAYATDTLIDVIDRNPELLEARVLLLESTFLDDRKGRGDARSKGHVHLDEIIERADKFRNDAVVLIHFSQLYSPREVHAILKERCPDTLRGRLMALAPHHGPWPG